MSYRNKTYIIFDGDEDMWAYGFMKGWKENDRIDFDFHDAHDIKPLTDNANEETVKRRLRERMANSKQAIVLIGKKTKNLYRFVRWEIEIAKELGLPIIAVNLNNLRKQDDDLCPPILKDHSAVHVSFKMKIVKHALDNFPSEYETNKKQWNGARVYNDSVYTDLGL